MPSKKNRSAVVAALEAEKLKLQREQELVEERERSIERIKVETRQRSLRAAILSDSVQSFENLLHEVREHKKPIRDEDEWQKYLKCEELTDTKIPSDVRDFVYKWQKSLSDHWNQQINWWLKCDDRSVLTQVPEVQDVRRKLMQTLRQKTGKFYDRKLRSMIKVYNSLLETLRRRKISSDRYEDLLTIRDVLRETAFNFLDVLTFEVLMHIDREMVSSNALMSNYSISAPDFIKYVWSFKDVPLPMNYNNLKTIKMDPLNMIVTVSNIFDLSSSSVRGLWFKHDFLSDFCQSFNPIRPMVFVDLATAVSEEMRIKKAMTEKHLTEMRKKREAYDKVMEEKRLAEEANKSKKTLKVNLPNKMTDKKSKVKFVEPFVPPVVDEATFVDVEDEYMAYEEIQLQADQETFTPENLALSEYEVNMRNFQVTNGVFKIECFERPTQTKEINFQMFIRLDEHPHIIKLQQFHHVYEPSEVTLKKDDRKSQIGQKFAEAKKAALADLMKVEVNLNPKFFWWECPTVCRWEPWEESEEFASLDLETQHFNLHFDDYVKRENEKKFSALDPRFYKKPKDVEDFNLTSPPDGIKLSEIFKNYVVPTMPNNFQFFNDKLQTYELKRREWRDILEVQTEIDANQITEEEFNELFEKKAFRARDLFPLENRQLLNVLPRILPEISEMKKLQEKPKKFDEEADDTLKPLKNEPLLLSEFLQEVETANSKLRPLFCDFESSARSISTASFQNSTELKDSKKTIQRRSQKQLQVSHASKVSSRHLKPTRSKGSTFDSKSSIHSSKDDSMITVEDIAECTENVKCAPAKRQLKLIPHHRGKWSTRDIYEQSYDAETKTVTFYTGRLGSFAFATRKYSNFPLKSWEICPEISDHEKFVVLKVETQNVNIEFKITNDGYTFKIFFSKKLPPQQIQNPVKVFELKKILSSLNMNLFPEVDANCYINNNCDKHKPMEFHSYKSMAVYCLSHNFKWNVWNRWAHRRVAIFDSRMILKKNFKTLVTTPLMTASVNVREKCTELDVVELDYEMNPMEQEFRPDLLNFLDDEVDKREHRANLKHSMMIWFVQALLMNIQPLSFSR